MVGATRPIRPRARRQGSPSPATCGIGTPEVNAHARRHPSRPSPFGAAQRERASMMGLGAQGSRTVIRERGWSGTVLQDGESRAVFREQGSGTVLTVILLGAMVILLPAVLALASAYQANQRARAAADLGAIAAVSAFVRGVDANASCAAAARVVAANRAEPIGCALTPEGRALVSTQVRVDLPIVGARTAAGSSRAGPRLTTSVPGLGR